MRLQLFDFIDEIINCYEKEKNFYEEENTILINFFTKNFQDKYNEVT